MKDDESQSKGGPVTKATKSSKTLIKGKEIQSRETLELECASINFQDPGEPSLLTAPRQKKGSHKNDLAEQIGLGLRSVYDDVLAQPVPDRFFELLRQLETVSGAQSKKGAT